MTIYVDKITMDFNTEGRECSREGSAERREAREARSSRHPPHCERQCVRCKEWKNLVHFKRYYHCKTGRYLMQYRYTVTCCECLDGMKKYNDRRKCELKT